MLGHSHTASCIIDRGAAILLRRRFLEDGAKERPHRERRDQYRLQSLSEKSIFSGKLTDLESVRDFIKHISRQDRRFSDRLSSSRYFYTFYQ
jgi:hypothetical protein